MNLADIVISVGHEFGLTLEANPSTGYLWHEYFDTNVLRLVEKSYLATRGVEKPGFTCYTFKALTAGESSIAFEYKRPWENAPEKEFTVGVRVEE